MVRQTGAGHGPNPRVVGSGGQVYAMPLFLPSHPGLGWSPQCGRSSEKPLPSLVSACPARQRLRPAVPTYTGVFRACFSPPRKATCRSSPSPSVDWETGAKKGQMPALSPRAIPGVLRPPRGCAGGERGRAATALGSAVFWEVGGSVARDGGQPPAAALPRTLCPQRPQLCVPKNFLGPSTEQRVGWD